jgi:hypothetical protein
MQRARLASRGDRPPRGSKADAARRQLGRGAEHALMVMEMESKTVSEKWIGITRRASNSCD